MKIALLYSHQPILNGKCRLKLFSMRDKCGDVGRIKRFDHVERYSLHYLSGQSFSATLFGYLFLKKVRSLRGQRKKKCLIKTSILLYHHFLYLKYNVAYIYAVRLVFTACSLVFLYYLCNEFKRILKFTP